MNTNIRETINVLYKIGCYIGTICITFLLFQQYFSNKDASIVQVKTLEEMNRNSFPAITLCFFQRAKTDDLNLFDNQYILSTTGLTGKQYRDTMMGTMKMNHSDILNKINFKMATIKLKNYLSKFRIHDGNHNDIIDWDTTEDFYDGRNISESLPIHRYYQDPLLICYSYHPDIAPNISLKSISLYFSLFKLQRLNGVKIYIYVHYNNQLLRNMRHLYSMKKFDGINSKSSNNELVFRFNSISIMRSRKDANKPCNEDLQNDDAEWMRHVVTLIGCFPPYWRNMYSWVNNFNECNTTEQLKNASRYLPYHNEGMVKSVLKMYHPPCDQMRVLSSSSTSQATNENLLKISFRIR